MSPREEHEETPREGTRTLLLEAARRLFAEQGIEATTIRQISEAAGVTERTFYRYFDGKEGLVAGDSLAWLDTLHVAILERPSGEGPYTEGEVDGALAETRERLGGAAAV